MSSAISTGAPHAGPRKAVRFSFEVEEIESEYPQHASLSTEEDDETDLESSSGGPSTSTVPLNARPSSPPMRKRDVQLLDLTGKITREHKFPSAHGGFADVWIGVWHKGPSVKAKVAIKVLRSQSGDDTEKLNKRLRRELRVWRGLVHENVLPLLGTCSDFGPYCSMVCPWLQNGNLNKYLEHRGSTLTLVDRFRILRGVAAGLSYLHSYSVVHGDLTGSNVLIGATCEACLCDFGLSTIQAEFQGTSYFTSSAGGAVRWAAPELYYVPDTLEDDGDLGVPSDILTEQCDIYSFGSVVLQTLSGRVPYYTIRRDPQVLIELSKGKHPPRPSTHFITDTYWYFIKQCWALRPVDRPLVEHVLEYIEEEYDFQLAKTNPLCDLTGQVERVFGEGYIPFEFVHVWEGVWFTDSTTRKVAVKILRPQTDFDESRRKEIKRLRRDLRLWQSLEHKNVLPLYGVVSDFGPLIAMVVPDVGDMTLVRYLNHFGDELTLSGRFMLLYEISAGLCYLHSMSVIHGGLSGCSILINEGNAYISDFGLIPIMAEFQTAPFTSWCGEVVRWADPTLWLFNGSHVSITKHSDIYAFGSLMLQILTSKIPFAEWKTPMLVSLMKQAVLLRPPRPDESEGLVEDDHWEFMEQCWSENPLDRPTVEEVSAYAQWFYACPPRNPVPQSFKPSRRLVRLLRRRSIVVEDDAPAPAENVAPSRPRVRLFSARPRSIVNDNDSTDDEVSDAAVAMGNLRT